MKYLVAFILIASVAAGNLRALEHDDSQTGAFVEMKENSSDREIQPGNETMLMKNRAIRNETPRERTLVNNQETELPRIEGVIPAYEVQEKEQTDTDETESDPDFEVRIVGGEVSDSNEFPYYGTSIQLKMQQLLAGKKGTWLIVYPSFHRSELVWVRCDVDWTRYCYRCCSLWELRWTNGHNRYSPTRSFCATHSPQLQQQYHAE